MKHCVDCGKLAEYIRHTQFSGSHPFCEEHAKKEKDFYNDNSVSWEKI